MAGKRYDAVVVGTGPNGLAAAITIARTGRSVIVFEASEVAGGGVRSEQLTLPGFIHDVCSAVHPLAVTSPFMRSLSLEKYGLKWIYPPSPLAHPLDDGTVVMLERSLEETAANLGDDEDRYRAMTVPFIDRWQDLFDDILRPALHLPRHPLLLGRFGIHAVLSAEALSCLSFRGDRARALFIGIAAHTNTRLDRAGTAGVGLGLLLAAHARGWPIPKGGAQRLTDALVSYLKSLGGEVVLGVEVRSLEQLPESRWVFLDVAPSRVPELVGARLSVELSTRLQTYRHGPGVFKMDWALSAPIPWRSPEVARAGTVHLGGSMAEVVRSERGPELGEHSDRPFVLLSQPSLFDASRCPPGQHTAWAYSHVPNGSTRDMSVEIESQIERFAPGFQDRILRRSTLTTVDMQRKNSNLVGGDIGGGAFNLMKLARPLAPSLSPYRLGEGLYLCSSSTPPGPGVHGMCGFHAVAHALRESGR